MASGWRKSTLSAMYALVASFLLVFLLGAVFKKESEPVLASPSTVPAAQQVVIKLDRSEDQGPATFKVCLTLKQGWSVTRPKTTRKDGDTNTSCTNDPIDGQKPIEFVLRGDG